jgi:hypothetical protein
MEKIPIINSQDLGPDFIKPEYKDNDYSNYEPPKESPIIEEIGNEEDGIEEVEEIENLPKGMVSTMKLAKSLNSEELREIYEWYSSAMDRRDREPLEYDRFCYHFFEGASWEPTYAMGDMEKGFVFGFYKHEIFIPTHFAPKTMKGGYSIFKELAENKELPVASAVTDDLAKTLLKMKGWHKLKIGFLAYFNSELKKKTIIYNSAEGVRTKIIGLMKEFWDETRKLKREQQEIETNSGVEE